MKPLKTHPDFKYIPSDNPYWHKIKQVKPFAFTDNDTEEFKGKWKSQFLSPPKKLHVEIGCNGAHVSLQWAKQNPQDGYIGIDWKYKQIYFAYEKAKKMGVQNLILLRAYAERTHYMFDEAEIDHLYLFFPDPWEKMHQKKHRIVTKDWLIKIAHIVKKGGTFEIRTDHKEYFEWMQKQIAQTQEHWSIETLTSDRHKDRPDAHLLKIPEVTLFERVFIRDQLPIHQVVLKRT